MENIINYKGLVNETEKPAELFSNDTHEIIYHRYNLAIELATNKRSLEIGAGSGLGFKLIANAASFAVAGEYCSDNRKMIKAMIPNANIVGLNGEFIPFYDSSFDVIIALAMIYYMDFNIFIAESMRVLSSSGKLFFCTSNCNVPGFVPSPYTVKYYSIPDMRNKLIQGGFEPKFYGAFPAEGGGLVRRKIRAFIKKIAKLIVHSVPKGNVWWERKRESIIGD